MKKLFIPLVCLLFVSCAPVYGVSQDIAVDVPVVKLDHGTLYPYFNNMEQDPAPAIVNLFASANNTIDIAIYSLTNPRIIVAIDNAKLRGIQIRLITDKFQAVDRYERIALNMLASDNIPIKVNSHPGAMHTKMAIVDDKVVAFGSYDYTLSSSQTDDDMMVIMHEKQFADLCKKSFEQMWSSDNFQNLYK